MIHYSCIRKVSNGTTGFALSFGVSFSLKLLISSSPITTFRGSSTPVRFLTTVSAAAGAGVAAASASIAGGSESDAMGAEEEVVESVEEGALACVRRWLESLRRVGEEGTTYDMEGISEGDKSAQSIFPSSSAIGSETGRRGGRREIRDVRRSRRTRADRPW
jgi:hypothetical protein